MDKFSDNSYSNLCLLRNESLEPEWYEVSVVERELDSEYPMVAWAIEEYESIKEKDRLARGASRGRALLYSVGLTIGGAASLPLIGLGLALVIATCVCDVRDTFGNND